MFALPNMFHLFANKLAGLSAGRFAFALVLARAFNCFFFWHNKMVSPLAVRLDVISNRRYSGATIASQLSAVAMAFPQIAGRACEQIWRDADARREAQPCRHFCVYFNVMSDGANGLLSFLRLISDQAFRHGWPLAACWLEFLAPRIVIKNKEVLNFAY